MPAFVRFLVVGGAGFIIDVELTQALIHFGLSALPARVPAIMAALLFTCSANRQLTVLARGKATGAEAVRYFTVAVSTAPANYLLYSMMVVLGTAALVAITLATAGQTVLSFLGYRAFVFRQGKNRSV